MITGKAFLDFKYPVHSNELSHYYCGEEGDAWMCKK